VSDQSQANIFFIHLGIPKQKNYHLKLKKKSNNSHKKKEINLGQYNLIKLLNSKLLESKSKLKLFSKN
jgi:hypothetical protein